MRVRSLQLIDEDTVEVFLPGPDDCYERLRRAHFGATVSYVYCNEIDPVIKRGTTGKGAQQYRCKECESYFNDRTGTVFEHRTFPIEEVLSQTVQNFGIELFATDSPME